MGRPDRSTTAQNRWIIAALWLFLYGSFALLSPPLLDGADSLHAEAAREMLLQADSPTTFVEHVSCPDRGPMLCWSAATSMRVFGVGAPQARLPVAFCCLLLFLLVEAFARFAFHSQRAGLYAAVCLMLNPAMFGFTRLLTPAAMVCLWHVAAMLCFYLAPATPGRSRERLPLLPCLGFVTACGLNVLTAGLSGPVISVAAVMLYLLVTQVGRGAPLLWNAPDVKAATSVQQRVTPARTSLPKPNVSLLLAVASVIPLAFAAWTRQFADAVPSLPFLSMLIAQWLDREATETEAMTIPPRLGPAGARIALALLLCGVAAFLVCGGLLLLSKAPSPHADLAAAVRRGSGGNSVSFFRLLALNGALLGAFRGPLVMAALAMSGGTLLNWHLRRSFQPHRGNMALAAATLLLLTAGHVALNTVSPVFTSQRLAATIAPLLKPKNLIFVNGDRGAAATMAFYLGVGDVHLLHHDAPDGNETLQQKWSGPERIFLWTDPVRLPPLPSKAYIVAEDGGKQIVSNKAGPY